jgi:hypothetical protein
MSRPNRFKAIDQELDTVANALGALDQRENDLGNRVEAVEGVLRKNQVQTAQDQGLPADLVAVETNAWRRLSPARNRWPEIAAFDERAAELEMRLAEVSAELREQHELERAAPAVDAAALAEWELADRNGPRPAPTLPAIKKRIKELQADWEALNVAVGRVLVEKEAHWKKHRARLIKDADTHADQARSRYLEAVDQLEAAREDLRVARRTSVVARLYPSEIAGAEPPDSLAGGRKRALVPLGVNAPVSLAHLFAALREDARYLSEACTPEQRLAMQGRDPRQPPQTEWVNDPAAKAARDKAMAEWAARP